MNHALLNTKSSYEATPPLATTPWPSLKRRDFSFSSFSPFALDPPRWSERRLSSQQSLFLARSLCQAPVSQILKSIHPNITPRHLTGMGFSSANPVHRTFASIFILFPI